MESYLSPKVKIRQGKIGKGLFAVEKIGKGELIADFASGRGRLMPAEEADRLYKAGNDYMLQVDDNLFFAAADKNELEDADFINHSCNPNCGIKETLKIVAMRDISEGEEMTFDYAMSESSSYTLKCMCGSHNCRKLISGEDWKREDLQKRYSGFFSDYLQRRIDRQIKSC